MSSYYLEEITSKELINQFFQNHLPALHIYEIGDLDEFFFPYTTWYALLNREDPLKTIHFIILLYQSPDFTVLLAFGQDEQACLYGQEALKLLRPQLPPQFYSHLTPALFPSLLYTNHQADQEYYRAEPHGLYLKMAIKDISQTKQIIQPYLTQAKVLYPHDLPAINLFYQEAYPGNWFDARMLETEQFFGIWDESLTPRKLIAIAGIHVYSPMYHVAALGNIATHPNYRKQGLARLVTSSLIDSLIEKKIETIGLNVKADNHQAIALYQSLGFEIIGEYIENMLFQNN